MAEKFRPPGEVENEDNKDPKINKDETKQVDSLAGNASDAISVKGSSKKEERHFWDRGLEIWPTSEKQKIIGASIIAGVLVLGIGGAFALSNMFKNEPQPTEVVVKKEPKKTVPSKLTGVDVSRDTNKKRVIGIMIENSPDARPQAALIDSGIVFEAIAEGGITRFLTLHLEDDPSYIGPVRSVRPYYAEWARGFDAALAHAGGSAEGIVRLQQLKVPDLDYTIAGGAFQRVSDRYAPHNLYTNMGPLRKEAKRLKYEKESKFTPIARKKEQKDPGKATVKKINFSISGGLYDASFTYDKESNRYKRSMAGQPHRDHKSGKQISPKVVVALITNYSQNGIYSVYRTTGKGQVIVFQDGKAIKGTWKRNGAKGSLQFYDSKGNPLRINPGQTWITALRDQREAKYGP